MFINICYLSGLHTCHVVFQGPVQGSNLHNSLFFFFSIFKLLLSKLRHFDSIENTT